MTKKYLAAITAIPLLAACSTTANYQQVENPVFELGEYSTISGSMTYRERMALPPGSFATISLQEMSRADAMATIVDSATYSVSSVPFGFELRLPNREMPRNAQYSVRGQIHGPDGALLYTTDTVNPVMRRPIDQELGEIVMVRAN